MGIYRKITKRKTLAEKTARELGKVLDRVFSEFIRLRDADEQGYCRCVTCGGVHHWKEIHCGHFIGRANKAVRFNELNCHAQCVKCNTYRSGEHHIYRQVLVNKYGKEAVDKLENEAYLGGDFTAYGLQVLIGEYREKVRLLKREKGI